MKKKVMTPLIKYKKQPSLKKGNVKKNEIEYPNCFILT